MESPNPKAVFSPKLSLTSVPEQSGTSVLRLQMPHKVRKSSNPRVLECSGLEGTLKSSRSNPHHRQGTFHYPRQREENRNSLDWGQSWELRQRQPLPTRYQLPQKPIQGQNTEPPAAAFTSQSHFSFDFPFFEWLANPSNLDFPWLHPKSWLCPGQTGSQSLSKSFCELVL